jgi:hypothetical protein
MKPEEEERLRSGKAVAAVLLLAAVVLSAAAVALWVLFSRSCAGRRAAPAAVTSSLSRATPSI